MHVNLRLAGAAGQGIHSATQLLGKALTRSGSFAQATTHVESRVRGGLNWVDLRCGTTLPEGVSRRVDVLAALNDEAALALCGAVAPRGLVLAPNPPEGPCDGLALADAIGSTDPRQASTVLLGALVRLLGIPRECLEELLAERWKGASLDANRKALDAGMAAAAGAARDDRFRLPSDGASGRLWLSGHEAVALGAVAGGVTFMAAYPMSPATGILTTLQRFSEETELAVVQCEDEIAAANMAVGAGFAGGRALTATSGGGFCLMTEALSLSAITESPMVCVLAQRPGPATGMATRTAQDDLLFAIHGGHGPIPRIVLAPADLPEAFRLTAEAFDLAESWQCPVLVLTDQQLQDGSATVDELPVADLPRERHVLPPGEPESEEALSYRRYESAADGLSPMALPGASTRLVCADSHTHDEAGHITEQPDEAAAQTCKLLDKIAALAASAPDPPWPEELPAEGFLVLSWGSTRATVAEACRQIEARGARPVHLHFSWLWPAPAETFRRISQSDLPIVTIECAMGGVFADYVQMQCTRRPDLSLRRLDGRPHSVEELVERLTEEVAA